MKHSDWDAATYDRIADPMFRWGVEVLDRLPLRGDERVLDAGCGSGRVTEALLARLPHGEVVALDASPAMLEQARQRLVGKGRVTYVLADLARSLPIHGLVDHILSTATFHWVSDHDAMFGSLAAAIRPGGYLVAQCGGLGNIAGVLEAVRRTGVKTFEATHFASPEETRRRLGAAGFSDVECWLNPEPTQFQPGESFETYLTTVCLRPFLQDLMADERQSFVRQVADNLPRCEIDYVRLNILARRSVAD